MKYLRKPYEVDAIQWLGVNFYEIKEKGGDNFKLEDEKLFIKNGDDWVDVNVGDYITCDNNRYSALSYEDFYNLYQKTDEDRRLRSAQEKYDAITVVYYCIWGHLRMTH